MKKNEITLTKTVPNSLKDSKIIYKDHMLNTKTSKTRIPIIIGMKAIPFILTHRVNAFSRIALPSSIDCTAYSSLPPISSLFS